MTDQTPLRLAVVSIRAQDVPTTVHFYRDLIGLQLLLQHGHQPAFDLGNNCHLVIVQGKPATIDETSSMRFPVIAFAVKDLNLAVAQLREHQVEMPWGIESNDQARWVEFFDPAGNLIELAQFSEN